MTKRIITAFANSGTKNTIPDTAPGSDDGFANYPNGFPVSNSIDPALGGSYVKRADFNGAMYDVTSILKDQAHGLIYAYDATYATAISGYPVAAILSKVGGVGFWLNTTAGNATNPDTGGAGWVDFSPKSIQNNLNNHATAGGSADAITATYAPAYAAWIDGMTFFVKLTAANTTTTPTVSPNGLTAKTIVKGGGTALSVGDQAVGMIAEYKYNSTLDKVILQNPQNAGRLIGQQSFLTAGTFAYTPTAGTTFVIVEAVGGGGSSNSWTSAVPAGYVVLCPPAAPGAYGKGKYTTGFSGVTVTVGAGGVVPATGLITGGTGGTTSFGALMTCAGGVGGTPVTSNVFPYNTAVVVDTAAPSGANICSSVGVAGGQGLAVGTVYGNGVATACQSAFPATNGNGAIGLLLSPGGSSAGYAGKAGGVIIWEYA